ncbi:MAG: TolC family protein [Candidatus Korobacteraceae bacterium]
MKVLTISVFVIVAVAARAEDPYSQALAYLSQEHAHPTPQVRPLTLPELEAGALSANPELKLFSQRIAVRDAQVPGAGALDDPSLMYRGWGVPVSRPWDFNQAQNMFMYIQTLPGPGKRALRSLIAAQQKGITEAELEAKKREVIARVRTAFYELLRSYDELRLHEQQAALARQALESARIKYTVGRVPQQDVLKAQIGLSKLLEHLLMFQQEGELARATLNSLMGRDPASPLEVTGTYDQPTRLPVLADLKPIALRSRPELTMISAAIQQAETKANLAQKSYTPDFSVSGGYMLMPSGSPSRNAFMGEVSITLPWLNRSKHDAEIASAQAELAALQAEYQLVKANVLHEVRDALIRAGTALRMVGLYRDTLRPQTQTTLKATVAAYQTERTDFLNLLDSQNVMLDVEYAYYRALSEYEQHVSELERSLGSSLRDPAIPPEVLQ